MMVPTNNTLYGARSDYEHQISRRSDITFDRISSEEEDYDSPLPVYEINTYPADFTLEVLHEKWKNGDIEISLFQRQFVWKQAQASKLIESFLIGLPVPAIFLYTERKSQKYLVVDGQQRLRSVFYFFQGYFGEERKSKDNDFQLKGLRKDSKYCDKTFSELEETDQRKLRNSVLRSFIVQQLNPNDDTSIYHIFERLNTGGTFLSNQEIRNCVCRGKFNNLLQELNELPAWREIVGRPKPDSRQKDVELILRFFALLEEDLYRKPMKEFLSTFMKKNKNPNQSKLGQLRKLFENTSETIIRHLGEKPFHLRAGLNSAVFDCVMVSFAKNLQKVPEDLTERYEKLKEHKDFLKYVVSATTDDDAVKTRFKLARQILFQK